MYLPERSLVIHMLCVTGHRERKSYFPFTYFSSALNLVLSKDLGNNSGIRPGKFMEASVTPPMKLSIAFVE